MSRKNYNHLVSCRFGRLIVISQWFSDDVPITVEETDFCSYGEKALKDRCKE